MRLTRISSKMPRPPADEGWIWIEALTSTGVWLPLYNFRPSKQRLAKGTLVALLNAEPGSKLDDDHFQYEDFRLKMPGE